MSFTEPKPDYRAIDPDASVWKLLELGYDVDGRCRPFDVVAGLLVSMAEQIEHLKQELSKKQDKP